MLLLNGIRLWHQAKDKQNDKITKIQIKEKMFYDATEYIQMLSMYSCILVIKECDAEN